MYSAYASPVSDLEYLERGGGAETYRDQAIVKAKLKAIRELQSAVAQERAGVMQANLDQKIMVRNLTESDPQYQKQAMVLLVTLGVAYLIGTQLTRHVSSR